MIQAFENYLYAQEKSIHTIQKYKRDINIFLNYLNQQPLTKENTIQYKQYLINQQYAVTSINSMIASLNCYLEFINQPECKLKSIKVQKQIYTQKELTKEEYFQLLNTAKKYKNQRLYYILQTICATGIRVSELQYITVEAVKKGVANVNCKGKIRTIFIVKELQMKLLKYIKQQKIKEGSIFITKHHQPINRSNLWKEMKLLCKEANVDETKVFPHNLRHLFARTFYKIKKDIAKLADILGHSSIDTTRIYIISTGKEHQQTMEQMHLLL